MPMFKALKLCPDAVVIRPDFAKYAAAARQVRALMGGADAAGAAAVDRRGGDGPAGHRGAARRAAGRRCWRGSRAGSRRRWASRSRSGWRPNRLLAKIAAGRDKPRGFAVLGARRGRGAGAGAGAACCPASARCWSASCRRWASPIWRICRRWTTGRRGRGWARTARAWSAARAARMCAAVQTGDGAKSISAGDHVRHRPDRPRPALERQLWRMAEKLARRLREKELAAGGVVLKLKTARFALRTRNAAAAGADAAAGPAVRGGARPCCGGRRTARRSG